jgi:hypothetical protein
VLAIDASSDTNAWMLARDVSPSDGILLLQRDSSGGAPVWRPRSLAPSPFAQGIVSVKNGTQTTNVRVSPRPIGQPLTVSSDGVWIDAQLTPQGTTTPLDATLYFRPSDNSVHSWCDAPAAIATLCDYPLGSPLPAAGGRSFAWWTGEGFGQRVITGLDQGAILSLQGTAFARQPAAGGNAGSSGGAAFSAPDEGWLAAPLVHVTRSPEVSRLQAWPVPFRHPLTAIAPQPGAPVGAIGSQALAIGDDGQVARYTPGQGWVPEPLLTATGARAKPRLRGVAWPEPDRAYAVGDHAEMWLWRSDTGLWEPDPSRPPNFQLANLTGIAFDPTDPRRGYAIGKQDVLLRYGKEWEQDTLPAGLSPLANFSSIAFAGNEALVTYKVPTSSRYEGGLIVNSGGGWRIDGGITAALGGSAPERVAGLPDGGAVVASIDGRVAERDGPSAPWQPAPSGSEGYPSALAAIRENGQVRAVLSVDTGPIQSLEYETDSAQVYDQPPSWQAPLLTDPYPLPTAGFLLRQTATGWRDEEHQAFPTPEQFSTPDVDYPLRPDAVLALALDPSGDHGWAVGGETGTFSLFNNEHEQLQTAGVMRYPAEGAQPPSGTASAPIATEPGTATFAIGGNAQCAGACADLGNTDIGPDAWLPSAVARAAGIGGLRAFLYTGPGVADGLTSGANSLDANGYARESARYATRLGSAAGSLPVFAAVTPSDLDTSGSLTTFAQSFAGFEAPLGGAAPGAGISPVSALDPSDGAFSFDSSGPDGTVRVIVLGFTGTALGETQRCWLAQQLSDAGTAGNPAIVIGNRDVSPAQGSPTAASDGEAIAATLVTGAPPAQTEPGSECVLKGAPSGASAYFFDYPKQNRAYALMAGGRSIPSFGSGTLGYIDLTTPTETDFVGASGFLLASVDVAQRDPTTNVAPVSVKLIPNIDDLALDATDGTLLRRSQPALFEALARRPRAGLRCNGFPTCGFSPNPYIPIPSLCQGPRCASGIFPTYAFTSSNPDIADFVERDPASTNPRHVLLGANDKPIADPTSGLLCAFNAGTTTVTVNTGGLSYSEQVTVLPGSAQRPCGTVPLRNPPTRPVAVGAPAPPPGEVPQPQPQGGSTPLPPPSPPLPGEAPPPPRIKAGHVLSALPLASSQLIPILATVPPPAPPTLRPTPPSGGAQVPAQSPVTQPVGVAEREEEELAATQHVHNMSAYVPDRESPIPAWSVGLVLVLLAAGIAVRPNRGSREPVYLRASGD